MKYTTTHLFEQLKKVYEAQLWVKFDPLSQEEKALPNSEDYSHDTAEDRAYLNTLCLNVLLDVLTEKSHLPCTMAIPLTQMPSIWEFVTGIPIKLAKTPVVIIATDYIDTDEFNVPQEWVDIPQWAADYYMAVQINLDDGWLRVWGFTTYETLKQPKNYQPSDRSYSLSEDEVIDNIPQLWELIKQHTSEKASRQSLPNLFTDQQERLMQQLSKPTMYSPRLQERFEQFGAILANETLRQQLYEKRTKKVSLVTSLTDIAKNAKSHLWVSLDELGKLLHNNNLVLKTRFRSSKIEPEVLYKADKGRIIDLETSSQRVRIGLVFNFTLEESLDKNDTTPKGNIVFKAIPANNEPYLPPGLKLTILDQGDQVFIETQARNTDNWIQLKFTGDAGEKFKVKVTLEEATIIEELTI